MKIFKLPIVMLMLMTAFAIACFFLWAIIFYAHYTAFFALVGILVFLPVQLEKRRSWIIRFVTCCLGLILLLSTIHIPFKEVNGRIRYLASKPRNEKSVMSFSTRQKMGIYGLNIMMGVLAYPIYPEVSRETLMMIFPSPKNGIRTFESDFSLKSKKVRMLLKKFNKTLKKGNATRLKKRIYWSLASYRLGSKEARYALALNPSDVSLKASKQGSKWIIAASLKVKCRYPKNTNVTLISNPELKIEEGLFWVLQQAGWLHPYTAEWKFIINSDDVRIN